MRSVLSVVPLLVALVAGWVFQGYYLLLGLSGAILGVIWPFIAMPIMRTARHPHIPVHKRVEFAPAPTSAILTIGALVCAWVAWKMASTDLLSRMSLGKGSMMAFLMGFGVAGLLSSAVLVQRRGLRQGR